VEYKGSDYFKLQVFELLEDLVNNISSYFCDIFDFVLSNNINRI
jgi:hypothetical protein